MNFGQYSVIDTPKYYLDKEPTWYWAFRPITSEDDLRLHRFVGEKNRTWLEVAWMELALAFGGTNIPAEEGVPILGDDLIIDPSDPEAKVTEKIETVTSVLQAMPTQMVSELWSALGRANPLLGPVLPSTAPPEAEASPTL